MKHLRLHWTSTGWVVDVQKHLGPIGLANLIGYSVKVQTDRWRSMSPGDNKEAFGKALELLRQGKVTQRLLPVNGEYVLMEAKR